MNEGYTPSSHPTPIPVSIPRDRPATSPVAPAADSVPAGGLATLRELRLPDGLRAANREAIRAALAQTADRSDRSNGTHETIESHASHHFHPSHSPRRRRRASLVFGLAAALAAGLAAVVVTGFLGRWGNVPADRPEAEFGAPQGTESARWASRTQGTPGTAGTQVAGEAKAMVSGATAGSSESSETARSVESNESTESVGSIGSIGSIDSGGSPAPTLPVPPAATGLPNERMEIATATGEPPGAIRSPIEQVDPFPSPVGRSDNAGGGAERSPTANPTPLVVTPTATPPESAFPQQTFSSLLRSEKGRDSAGVPGYPSLGGAGSPPTPVPSGLPTPDAGGQRLVQIPSGSRDAGRMEPM